MKGIRFGLERIEGKRYSTPNNFRGGKLSFENLNKTMRMKLKKVEDINTSRSSMEMYSFRRVEEEEEVNSNEK